jgi:hypothetical protein
MRTRWSGYVAWTADIKTGYQNLFIKPERKRHFERPRHNGLLKVDLTETSYSEQTGLPASSGGRFM